MPRYRICKTFTVESGHMLSKHPERCRFPHGHTRRIEIVISSESLDANDMVVDFKALRMAVEDYVERYDHAIAMNSVDPLLPDIRRIHPESVIVFEAVDPTTEVIARDIYDFVADVLESGCEGTFPIPPNSVHLDRVRVWETPSSWAEYG